MLGVLFRLSRGFVSFQFWIIDSVLHFSGVTLPFLFAHGSVLPAGVLVAQESLWQKCPPTDTAGLQHFLLVILCSLLVHLDELLPSELPTEDPVVVFRWTGSLSPLRLRKFFLLSLPFLEALGHVNTNTPGPELSATDVAGDEGRWHTGGGAVLHRLSVSLHANTSKENETSTLIRND